MKKDFYNENPFAKELEKSLTTQEIVYRIVMPEDTDEEALAVRPTPTGYYIKITRIDGYPMTQGETTTVAIQMMMATEETVMTRKRKVTK